MKRWFTLLVVCFLTNSALGQSRVQIMPFDEGPQDAGFAAYRASLLHAVVARDIDAVLAATSPDVELSFGGSSGHQQLRANLTVEPSTLSEE